MICQNKRGKSFVGQVMLLKVWLSVQDTNNNEYFYEGDNFPKGAKATFPHPL